MPYDGNDPVSSAVEPLCREAAAGGANALTRLLALYHQRLLEHAVRKVGPDWRGKLEPEDILQEAYFDIFAGIATFKYQGVDSFYRWAAQIVDRRYIDHVRRLRAQKRDVARQAAPGRQGSTSSTYHALLDRCLADSRTPSRYASTAEAASSLMSALARLPVDYRNVLRRLYLGGETPSQVAAGMGRSEDAVRRLASRALDRLRKLLERMSS